jgi:hypothetical protein
LAPYLVASSRRGNPPILQKTRRLRTSRPQPYPPLLLPPTQPKAGSRDCYGECVKEKKMNGIIYLVGLVVVILAILSFFGLR